MWIVAIAWIYVALMMALAEATNPQGSILGAVVTFVMYGVAPMSLVMYLLGAPARRKALRAAEEAAHASHQADAGSLPTGHAIAPERKEP
jgi:hypothetical protein